ncbi:LexA family protein [Anaerococcus sp. DFU013_CI05]|uniref:LexA family protein n=1 Tax=unclassified Anaerococcus TaxID=2614126 RepID=UPI0019337A57|nr:XRE family transcriptional regulator [Anaerococcus sp. mt242]MBM0046665.1 helix-turn-helix domain-containing protein [Anaerococcus sp. mt242]
MISKNIRKFRNENNWTQKELADKLHVGKTTVSNYETGYSEPDIETQLILADLFGVSLDELNSRKSDSKIKNYITINVYGRVPAGIPIEAIEDIEDTEELSLKDYQLSKDYIGLIVDGDSMYPKYLKGDTIIVEVTPQCENGEDCVVYVNGYDATLKTVIKNDDGTITLQPINPSYPPTTYGSDDEPIKILGRVKEIRRKI